MSIASPRKILRLHALPAGNGDCFVLDYGEIGNLHRIVIDGGTSGTYPSLEAILEANPELPLELLVVTHIDSDHIAGILKLTKHEAFRRFKDIWFNGYGHLDINSSLESFGPRQGDLLTKNLLSRPWNIAFSGKAIRVSDSGEPASVTIEGGATITVLSPTVKHLAALRHYWDEEVRLAGLLPNQTVSVPPSLPVLQRMGPAVDNIDTLASASFKPDRAPANGSSIALLFEFEGRRILFGADAFADVLEDSVKYLTKGNVFFVDVFKLPHHGSQGNITTDLIKTIVAKNYLVVTDGSYHQHPDDIAIARVIKNSQNANIVFNYTSSKNKIWSEIPMERRKYNYTTQYPIGSDGIVLELILY